MRSGFVVLFLSIVSCRSGSSLSPSLDAIGDCLARPVAPPGTCGSGLLQRGLRDPVALLDQDGEAQASLRWSAVLAAVPDDPCWKLPELDAAGNAKDEEAMAGPYVSVNATCPARCPFSQPLPDEKCFKACVQAEYCKALHPFRTFADADTMECAPPCGNNHDAAITSCVECKAPGVCKRCSFWAFRAEGGRRCQDYWKYLWSAAYVCFLLSVLAFLGYLAYLQVRPIINSETLALAELHRDSCRPKQTPVGTEIAPQKLPLLTKATEQNIHGLGVMLYFRWSCFLLCQVAGLYLIFFLTFNMALEDVIAGDLGAHNFRWPRQVFGVDTGVVDEVCPPLGVIALELPKDWLLLEEADALQHLDRATRPRVRTMKKINPKVKFKPKVRPKTRQGGEDESSWQKPAGVENNFPPRMAVMVFLAYGLSSIFALEFSRRQKLFAAQWLRKHPSHQDYAVLVSGLPEDATDHMELRSFFQDKLDEALGTRGDACGSRVVGVSIAYDYGEESELVQRSLDALTQRLVDNYDASGERLQQKSDAAPESERSQRCPSLHSLIGRVDDFMLPAEAPLEPNWEEDLREKLGVLPGTGEAYVVLSSPKAKDGLLALAAGSGFIFCGQRLDLTDRVDQPPEVLWQNFSVELTTWRLTKNASFLILVMVVWALIYVPYAAYSMSAVAVSQQIDSMKDVVLGMLIALGNTIVTSAIEMVVEQSGYKGTGPRDSATMGLVYLATSINILCDVIIVFFVIRSIAMDMAVYGTLDEIHYHHILARELYALLAPGYLITPYLIAPLFEDILPYYMNRRLLRSKTGISALMAQRQLRCPEFDIVWRYSDFLTGFTVCISLLMFSTHHMYAIMLWLIIAHILVFAIDQYRLTRSTSRSFHVTEELSAAFAYFWCLPTGFLGSIGVHWAVEAHWLQDRGLVIVYMLCFGIAHCVLYCSLLRRLRSGSVAASEESEVASYEETRWALHREGQAQTYFNTNPVHILRAWFPPEGESPLGKEEKAPVPYVQGLEYIQGLDAPPQLTGKRSISLD
mmetsp:Transcript_46581/g.101610  ORF Transcript_46581/g.101610 Transcript_46581/m.101610 type:complete len:1030 (-) Transcript_46581:43-3132(-)